MGTSRDRISRVVGRRGIAMVALSAAALMALIVAPAPSASAGRNSTGIKVHNQTSAATLVMTRASVVEAPYDPQWEDKKTPRDHPVIAPHRSAHYELLTQSGYRAEAVIVYDITVQGQTVGEVTVDTVVDGRFISNYGQETTVCYIYTGYPFVCRVTGSDTATITDKG